MSTEFTVYMKCFITLAIYCGKAYRICDIKPQNDGCWRTERNCPLGPERCSLVPLLCTARGERVGSGDETVRGAWGISCSSYLIGQGQKYWSHETPSRHESNRTDHVISSTGIRQHQYRKQATPIQKIDNTNAHTAGNRQHGHQYRRQTTLLQKIGNTSNYTAWPDINKELSGT